MRKSGEIRIIIVLITIGFLTAFTPIFTNYSRFSARDRDISSNYKDFNLIENIFNFETSGVIVEDPIFINGSATGLSAHNWSWVEEQGWCSGLGTSIDPYVIENLLIDGNNQSNCIEIHNSAKYLIIKECTVFNSSLSESDPGAGILLVNVSNSIIIDNECDYNAYGIFMEKCDNNNITGNSASFNIWSGFHLSQCVNNTISNNLANNNTGVIYESMGIYLNLCDFNVISKNTANYNKYGIQLSGVFTVMGSNNNTIANNTVSYNEVGIYIFGDFGKSYDNIISENLVSNNLEYGIRVSRSPHNIFCKNTVKDNDKIGISVWKESHNNTFTENFILNNGKTGLTIAYDCYTNLIYYNCFIGNNLHAQDNRTDSKWDNGIKGNYWDDYTGLDADGNGIGDVPYNISGSAGNQDNFPLMICPFSISQDGGTIPGYNLIFIFGILSFVTIGIIKKRK